MMTVHFVALNELPIFEQLQLEEALLRTSQQNFCLINRGSPPAIVMGISGKVDELVDDSHYKQNPIPIIRRFSGGGCVLVGKETLFITFIFNKSDVDIGTCPKKLLEWTEELLQPAFGNVPFRVRENDYVIGDKKFGGNAQYFTKDRLLHHTSLLWNFCPHEMNVLKMPPKMPDYRTSRPHGDFLTSLSSHFSSKEAFLSGITRALEERWTLIPKTHADLVCAKELPHRKATELL